GDRPRHRLRAARVAPPRRSARQHGARAGRAPQGNRVGRLRGRRPAARLTPVKRGLLAALALALSVFAYGCDELGNPGSARHQWPTASWSDGQSRLETRTFTVPPARSNELLTAIEPARLHHADFFAPPGGVVTLV